MARISIIKSKLDAYTFELKPFAPTSENNPSETCKQHLKYTEYTFCLLDQNASTKTVVATAKKFREEYCLKSSRIACQLLIKCDNIWRRTDIFCETNLMEESKPFKWVDYIEYCCSSRRRATWFEQQSIETLGTIRRRRRSNALSPIIKETNGKLICFILLDEQFVFLGNSKTIEDRIVTSSLNNDSLL